MSSTDPMLEVYLYENTQLLENFESLLLAGEKSDSFTQEQVADIFRILHTIKGSSAMMSYDNVANLSHALEDLFDYLREKQARKQDHSIICDLCFKTLDIINGEMEKIQANGTPDGDVSAMIKDIKDFHHILTDRKAPKSADDDTAGDMVGSVDVSLSDISDSNFYKCKIIFDEDCKMENVRALGIVKSIESLCTSTATIPSDLLGEHSDEAIVDNGFTLYMISDQDQNVLKKKIESAFFVHEFDFEELSNEEIPNIFNVETSDQPEKEADEQINTPTAEKLVKQNYMSVNLGKLDMLLDLVGEIVITESTVTKNPDVLALRSESFERASRQLGKLTKELQDIVMSIRMIPVSTTFHKMERIVRDMSNKTKKKANLVIIGEDTELDKNIIDHLGDPLMHMIRNSMDHGLEPEDERIQNGKNPVGTITLEACNNGADVLINVTDDGRGLNRDVLIEKGIEKGLITKPKSEVTDQEAYSLIFAAGLSTKEEVTEFSGRGVGMDVAVRNIEKMGGSVSVIYSTPEQGTSVQIRIPLTLAIIEGMQVAVGREIYIIPMLSIKESFKPKKEDIFSDPTGNEMIYLRGECYNVIRLHEIFGVDTQIRNYEEGILVIVEARSQTYCLFVDSLIGEQHTVVKPMPVYATRALGENFESVGGCTILGDGSVSLILDINGIVC